MTFYIVIAMLIGIRHIHNFSHKSGIYDTNENNKQDKAYK